MAGAISRIHKELCLSPFFKLTHAYGTSVPYKKNKTTGIRKHKKMTLEDAFLTFQNRL